MDLLDALRVVRRVADLPAGPTCACCGAPLPTDLPRGTRLAQWQCRRCLAAGCDPFQGVRQCSPEATNVG